MSSLRFGFGVAAMLLMFMACGDDDGDSSSSGAGGGTTTSGQGGAGGGTTSGMGGMTCDDLQCVACSDCTIATICKAENEACDANMACDAFGVCVNGCNGDGNCIQQCRTTNAAGVDAYVALIDCICGGCENACGANPLCQQSLGTGGQGGAGGN